MALTWDQTKSLIRIQGLIKELLGTPLASGRGSNLLVAIDRTLDTLTARVQDVLSAADADEAREFSEIVSGMGSGWGSAGARARAVLGWLNGAIEAETLEQRMEAEARLRRGTSAFGAACRVHPSRFVDSHHSRTP